MGRSDTNNTNRIVENTLEFVAQRGWQASGNGFFRDLVEYLGQALDVAYVFVDRIVSEKKDTVESIALYAHGEIQENIEYGLAGTPCENVIGRSLCCYPDRIQELFPKDELLVEMAAQSYAGIPLWAGDGRPLGLIAVLDVEPFGDPQLVKTLLQIVSTRASAELERGILDAELKASQQRFRDFAAASSDWFWEMDEDTRLTWISSGYEKVTGLQPEQYYGKKREEYGAPDPPDKNWLDHVEILNRHLPYKDYVFQRATPDGRVRWLRTAGVPVFDTDGNFQGYRGIGTDITDTVEAREQVEHEQQRFQDAVEVMSDGVALFDRDDCLIFCNKKFREFHPELSRALVPGVNFEALLRDHIDHGRIVEAIGHEDKYFQERVERHRNPAEPMLVERTDGRWLLVRDRQLADGCTLLVHTDLTEIKQHEEALRESEAKLSQAQKMQAVGQLTGGVAHDFNNLLAVIMGNAELLEMELGQGDKRVVAIHNATKRGASLVQHLLAFSRKQRLLPKRFDPGRLVSEMSELLGGALGETIEVELLVEPDLWTASADPGQLENAVLNLVFNARDAMPDGGKLTIACANASLADGSGFADPLARPGDYVVVTVRDTGCGIPKDVLRHVFEPFFTTKEVGEGSGLGLSMVYGFIHQSGGHIAVDSEVGRGTAVALYLPRATDRGTST